MTHENSSPDAPETSGPDSEVVDTPDLDWHALWSAHSPIGQLVLDRDCRISGCNDRASQLLGRASQDLQGVKIYDFAADDSVRALEVHLQRTTNSRHPQTCELHLLEANGGEFDALVHSSCVWEDDQPKYCLTSFLDIHRWKGAEPGKLLLEEQLRQSQRLEALGRLAAGVTHDFNNLLTLITGYSRLLTDQLRDDSQLRRHAEKIAKAGNQATELVSQLLAFSRNSELQSAVININEVLLDFETMLNQIVGEDIELKAVLDPDLANIRVNPSQFDQVVMNLATNARDAMPEGGTLSFETSDVHLKDPGAYGLPGKQPGRYVKLSVEDNGVGMASDIQEHIFDPFYTTKDVGKGTGLGLATVFSVVSQYGGTIEVESALGDGTAFHMFFPSADESVDRDRPPSGLPERSAGYETVLLVDENQEVRHFAATVLEDYGYKVLDASSPSRAVEVARDEDLNLSLVVMDKLETADRTEDVLAAIREAQPTAKILLVAGYSSTTPSNADVAVVLPKPYTPEKLAKTVRDVLDGG